MIPMTVEERSTIRRVSWRLLPLIVIADLIAYIDRTEPPVEATPERTRKAM